MDYYENLTYSSTEMDKDPVSMYNETDDVMYDAVVVPFNETHDCIRLLENSEVKICLDFFIELQYLLRLLYTQRSIYYISISFRIF